MRHFRLLNLRIQFRQCYQIALRVELVDVENGLNLRVACFQSFWQHIRRKPFLHHRLVNPLEHLHVMLVRCTLDFLFSCFSHHDDGYGLHAVHGLAESLVVVGLHGGGSRLLALQGMAVGAFKLVEHALLLMVYRLVPEHIFLATVRTHHHVAPHHEADSSHGLAQRVVGGIHPSALFLHLLLDALHLTGESLRIDGGVVEIGDVGGVGREVAAHGMACAPVGCASKLLLPLAVNTFGYAVAAVGTGSSGNTRHARAGKAVEHHVARLGVVQDVAHDGRVRHLGVVGMGGIYGVVLSLAYIAGIRFLHLEVVASLSFLLQLRLLLLPLSHKVVEPRIGASRVVRRVGKVDDVVVCADGETLYLAQFGQSLAQLLTEILTALGIRLEGDAKHCYGFLLLEVEAAHGAGQFFL